MQCILCTKRIEQLDVKLALGANSESFPFFGCWFSTCCIPLLLLLCVLARATREQKNIEGMLSMRLQYVELRTFTVSSHSNCSILNGRLSAYSNVRT